MPQGLTADPRFRLSESQAKALATDFGTPLYVVSEKHFVDRIRSYRKAFTDAEPHSEITFAAKANSTLALLAIAYREGCTIDVASEGELRAALAAGVPASACHLHGNNKQRGEIEFAIHVGVAHIVVDNFSEIEQIADLVKRVDASQTPKIVLRLAPGVDPKTHAKISTGQADTKFGFNIADGSARKAVKRCLALKLDLIGVHCHVGSQLLDPEAQQSGGALIAKFAADMKTELNWEATYINVGGGLGVRYTGDAAPMELPDYCRMVVAAVREALEGSGLRPKIAQEPGRSLIAEAGVTLYRVGVIKTVPITSGHRTFVAVDGGLSDNPRPALYGAEYTVERAARGDHNWEYVTDGPGAAAVGPVGDALFTVSGKHCETDRLFTDISLPADLAEGDLLQVLVTGAYNASMASTYNRYPRPAMVLIRENDQPRLIARRDSWSELFAREIFSDEEPTVKDHSISDVEP